jgi:hypothetical protein
MVLFARQPLGWRPPTNRAHSLEEILSFVVREQDFPDQGRSAAPPHSRAMVEFEG